MYNSRRVKFLALMVFLCAVLFSMSVVAEAANLPMPKKIQFTDKNGIPVTGIIEMKGGESREFDVRVVLEGTDYSLNYEDFYVEDATAAALNYGLQGSHTILGQSGAAVNDVIAVPLSKKIDREFYEKGNTTDRYKRGYLTTITVTALQPNYDPAGKNDPKTATLSFGVFYGLDGVTAAPTRSTLPLQFIVDAKDTGYGSDNGGGSCSTFGLGALLLAIPALGVLKLRRKAG